MLSHAIAAACVAAIAFVLWEAFEALVLPRRVSRPLRLAQWVTINAWRLWRRAAHLVPRSRRDDFLAVFGPALLLLIFALWAGLLIIAFAALHAARGSWVQAPEAQPTFATYIYLSATTFVTLGFGDVSPRSPEARVISDIEAGLGFGFLAIVIGYIPVLYGAFARREVEIGLLDARASTPPSAGELLRRVGALPGLGDLPETLRGWERWAAELLESHLSYPLLMYYRSQHDRQSWLATLTTILDTSAVLIATLPEAGNERLIWQARLTFAMARHAAVDLRLLVPAPPGETRLTPERQAELLDLLVDAGAPLVRTPETERHLAEMRALYEPATGSLSAWLDLPLPEWLPDPDARDNWRTSGDPRDHFFRIGADRRP